MTTPAHGTLPPAALLLLLVAALCHAGWNLLLKGAGEKFIATWWALVIVSLLALPILCLSAPLPRTVWPYALCSGLCEAAYYATLAAAYRDGEFSLIYPMARGTAPALITLWSVLFLGEHPRPAGLAGVCVIFGGMLLLGAGNRKAPDDGSGPPHHKRSSIVWALLAALLISMYSTIDGAAVKHCPPLPYTALIFILTTVFYTPFVLCRYSYKELKTEGSTHWLPMAVGGALSLVAYALVLAAYAKSSVSYAGAVREVSVVFGALAGWLWLGESFGARRTFAAALIFCGIFLIAALG